MASKKQRHHYIPEAYLKRFVNIKSEKMIHRYDKEEKAGIIISCKDAAIIKNDNRFKNKDGVFDYNSIENFYSQHIEQPFGLLMSKLASKQELNNDDLICLVTFIANMLTRVPTFRSYAKALYNGMHKALSERTLSMLAANRQLFESTVKSEGCQLDDKLLNETYDWLVQYQDHLEISVEHSHESTLEPMLDALCIFVNILSKFSWNFFAIDDGEREFITSDNPVIRTFSKPMKKYHGYITKDTVVYLPLSKTISLIGCFDDKRQYHYYQASEEMINYVNNVIVQTPSKYLYSSKPDILSDLLK